MKLFIDNSSSFVGKQIVHAAKQKNKEAKAAYVEANEEEDAEPFVAPFEVIEYGNEQKGQSLLEADVIIIDLERNPKRAMDVLQRLKEKGQAMRIGGGDGEEDEEEEEEEVEVEKEQVLISLSSVMTWSETQPNSKRRLHDGKYAIRRTSGKWKALKQLESLSLSSSRAGLTSFVLASGILYGGGEEAFAKYFQQAWLADPSNPSSSLSLKYPGNGNNFIPTINVEDLTSLIFHLAENAEENADQKYIVAVDKGKTTLKDIVTSISNEVGVGQIESVCEKDESVVLNQSGDHTILSCDMRFKQTVISEFPIIWKTPNGISKHIEQVREEYVHWRNTRPVRMMVYGPPGSGKTYIAKKLATKYYIPHLSPCDLIKEAVERGDDLSDKIAAVVAANAAPVKGKGKKKGGDGSGNGETTIPSLSSLPKEIYAEIVRCKLNQTPIRNRGYILDGVCDSYELAEAIYGPLQSGKEDDEEKEEGDEEEEEEEEEEAEEEEEDGEREKDGEEKKKKKKSNALPPSLTHFISLLSTKDECLARVQSIPEASVVPGVNDAAGIEARWSEYEEREKRDEDKDIPSNSPADYFRTVDVFELTHEQQEKSDCDLLSLLEMYVDCNGKANNFHPLPEEIAAAKEKREREEKEREEKEREDLEQKEKYEADLQSRRSQETKERKDLLLKEEREMTQIASKPLREYLLQSVVPVLLSGLVDVVKTEPEDPVDFIAEYLYRASETDSGRVPASV